MADPNYGGGYAQGTSSTMYSGTPSATGYGVSQGYQSTAAPGYQTATSSYQSAGYQVPGQAPAPTYAAPPAYQAPSQYSGYPADTSGSTVAGAVSTAYPTVDTSSYQGYGQPQTTSGYSSTSGGNYQQQGYQHGSSYQSSGHGGYGSQVGGYGGGGGYQGDSGRSSYGQQGASYGQGGGYGGGMQSGPRGGSRGGSRPGGYNSNVGYGDPSGGGSHQEGKEYEIDQVFVSSLASTVSEDKLQELFGSIGIIKMDKKTQKPKIWIYRHPDGTPKGDATITYDDPPTASAAIQWFNGKEFLGQQIKVEFAEKRQPKGGYGRGGGRGGPRGGRGGFDRSGGRDGGRGGGPGGGGGGPGGQGKLESRAGDWDCPSCGNMNFARRDTCNLCGTGRPGGDGGENGYGGRSGGRGGGWGGRGGGRGGGGPRGGGRGGPGGRGGSRGGRGAYDRQGMRQERRDRPY